jgi:ATP-dependent Clp protease, protease subunit
LHEPSGGVSGAATEVEIEARQVAVMRERLQRIFAEATGQPLEKLAREMKRNHWLTANEAVDYGLVGRIVGHVSELE